MVMSSARVCGTWPLKSADNFAGRALDGFGFVAEEAGGADEGFELGQSRFGHGGGGGEAAE